MRQRRGGRSLNTRLLAGMLAVTAAGLLVTCAISAAVLHRHLTRQQDDRLIEAINRPVDVKNIAPPFGKWRRQTYPSPFIVVRLRADGTAEVHSGSRPDPAAAVARVRRLGTGGLGTHARAHEPFDLTGDLRAAARPGAPGSGDIVVVAAPPGDVPATVRNLVLAEMVTGVVLIALLAVGGRWLIRRGLRPLDDMASTASSIATGGELNARMPDASPRTETGRLGGAINLMLGQIEQAFAARVSSEEKVRAFAADASHELRTPLTTIAGYAQLARQGAIGEADLPDVLRRIEDEARRMGTLVSELLELARLDRGAQLALAPADLAELARDAVADARAVEPSRSLSIESPESLVAVVDETRIRQVLANLLDNVRAHTPPSATAEIRLARDGEKVVLEVSDSGPGMEPGIAERAFDRFYRSTREASQDGAAMPGGQAPLGAAGGSGIGLAIVAAIADAHGGQARIRSQPTHGTTVIVTLADARTEP